MKSIREIKKERHFIFNGLGDLSIGDVFVLKRFGNLDAYFNSGGGNHIDKKFVVMDGSSGLKVKEIDSNFSHYFLEFYYIRIQK